MSTRGGLEQVSQFISKYFVVWVLTAAGLALLTPDTFAWIGDYISILLGVIMLGMGLTLTLADFRRIIERPRDVAIGSCAQWVIMPTAAYGLVVGLGLPTEVGIGLILLGAAPGGTASNVMTYLGKGDVALSVTITSMTTIAAPIVMPAWVVFLASEQIQVTFAEMFQEIVLIVLIPVVAGVVIRQVLDQTAPSAAEVGLTVFPAISVLAIVTIVAAIVGLNVENILAASGVALVAVFIHNALGLGAGYSIGHTTDMPEDRARACAFEVGMQNSGLAVAIAVAFFSPLAALVPALASVWQNITGPALATYFTRQTAEQPTSIPSAQDSD